MEWYEPRLNITSEFWGAENTTDDELIPGKNLYFLFILSYDDDDENAKEDELIENANYMLVMLLLLMMMMKMQKMMQIMKI